MRCILDKISQQHKVSPLQIWDYISAVVAGLVSLCVYIFCMTPGIPAGDGGELAVAIHYLGVPHAPGYPLHALLGKLFTVFPWGGSIAWQTNVFSGVCASITVFFTTLVAIRILLGMGESFFHSKFFGALAGLFLAFFPVFWSQAIFCEVYSVALIFQVAILWILFLWIDDVWSHRLENTIYMGQGHLLAISFLFGVALTGHLSVLMMQFLVAGSVLGVLFAFVFPQQQLTPIQILHGRKCVVFLVLCLGTLLCGVALTIIKSDMIGVGSKYGMGDVRKIIYAFFIPNIALGLMYCTFHYVVSEKLDPKNYLQQGTFLVIKMFSLLYLGYFINAYLYIRGNANPPINWGGIAESPDFLEKISKFLSVIFRKQYGDQGRVPISLESIFFSLEWILRILFDQVNWPLVFLMVLGGVALFQTHTLYALILIVGGLTFVLQMAVYLRIQDALWSQVSRVFFLFSLIPMAVLCSLGCAQLYKYCSQWKQKSIALAFFFAVLFLDTPLWSGFFPKAWIQNDRRQDKVCQDYANDMLSQCPSGSILLTEGPDNEVFPLLYSRYIENVRSDIDIFDQKGNIFPRIYGNFFSPNYPRFKEAYDLVRDLRDFQICSTGKPVFSTFPRDLKEISYQRLQTRYQDLMQRYPFLKDSPLGLWSKDFSKSGFENLLSSMVPSSVFNGDLSGQENLYDIDLKELGPWFLRQEGILYRVWPVHFVPLHILEFVPKATISQIFKGIQQGLEISCIQSEKQLQLYLDDLLKKGFIKKEQNTYFLVKTPWKTNVNWLSTYSVLQNYQVLQDRIHLWDYLISEVFVEYAKELLLDISRKKRIHLCTVGFTKVVHPMEENIQLQLFSYLERYLVDLRGGDNFYLNFWDSLKDQNGEIDDQWILRYQNLFQKFYPQSASVLGPVLLDYIQQQKKYWKHSSTNFVNEFQDYLTLFKKVRNSVPFFYSHKNKFKGSDTQWSTRVQYSLWEETLRMQANPDRLEKILEQTDFPFLKIIQANLWDQQGTPNIAVSNLIRSINQNPQESQYVLALMNILFTYQTDFEFQKIGYFTGLKFLENFNDHTFDFNGPEYLVPISKLWSGFVKNLMRRDISDQKDMIFKDISQIVSLYKKTKLGQKNYRFKKQTLSELLRLYKDCERISVWGK